MSACSQTAAHLSSTTPIPCEYLLPCHLPPSLNATQHAGQLPCHWGWWAPITEPTPIRPVPTQDPVSKPPPLCSPARLLNAVERSCGTYRTHTMSQTLMSAHLTCNSIHDPSASHPLPIWQATAPNVRSHHQRCPPPPTARHQWPPPIHLAHPTMFNTQRQSPHTCHCPFDPPPPPWHLAPVPRIWKHGAEPYATCHRPVANRVHQMQESNRINARGNTKGILSAGGRWRATRGKWGAQGGAKMVVRKPAKKPRAKKEWYTPSPLPQLPYSHWFLPIYRKTSAARAAEDAAQGKGKPKEPSEYVPPLLSLLFFFFHN